MCIDKDKREMEKDSEPVRSELEQMKELYKSGDYVCYTLHSWWAKVLTPRFDQGHHLVYVLVHKKHEAIADAVITNPDVEITLDNGMSIMNNDNFFLHYNDEFDYTLKEIKPKCDGRWNQYYIKASQEAYDKLVELGYDCANWAYDMYIAELDEPYLIIMNDEIDSFDKEKMSFRYYKPFYLVGEEFTECKECYSLNKGHSKGYRAWCKSCTEDLDTGSACDKDLKIAEIKKPKCDGRWNGYYIEASQEAYDKLVSEGYEANGQFNLSLDNVASQEISFFKVTNSSFHQNYMTKQTLIAIKLEINRDFKQLYLVSGELTDKPKGEKYICQACNQEVDLSNLDYVTQVCRRCEEEEHERSNNDNDDGVSMGNCRQINGNCGVIETISITAEDGTVYEFEKPEFECELIKVVDNKIVGYVINGLNEVMPKKWSLEGDNGQNYYNLTPIKKAWYEDESNFPAILICKETENDFAIVGDLKSYCLYSNTYRLATKEERDSLYCEGK